MTFLTTSRDRRRDRCSRRTGFVLGSLLVVVAPSVPAANSGPTDSPEALTRQLEMMGTELRVRVEASDRATALAASEAAVRSLAETERRLSTWVADSELARINEAPIEESLALSAEIAEDLASAERLHELTEGRFDPTVGALASAWGLRTGGAEPTHEELYRALARTGWTDLVELRDTTLRKIGETVLDEGGFGKGVGLDRALRAALDAGAIDVELDLGGQILTTASSGVYGVAHPDDRSRTLLEIRPERGSLATSGNGERGIVVAGERRGHLLDPATGWPAPDWGSLTVWARSATEADGLSTGLYVLGPDRALELAARHPDFEVLVLERDDGAIRARASTGLENRIRPLPDAAIRLTFVKPGADVGSEQRGDGEQHAVKANGSPPRVPSSTSVAAEGRGPMRGSIFHVR